MMMRVLAVSAAALSSLCGSGAQAAAPRNDGVYQAAVANRAGALPLLEQIVNIDSGTGDVAGGARVASVLAQRLKPLGAEVSVVPTETAGLPDSLVAVFHGTGKGKSSSSRTSTPSSRPERPHTDPSAWTDNAPMGPASAMRRRVWSMHTPR